MQYRFKHLEYNGLKGVIGEHLARSFLRRNLFPHLIQKEGWDHVVLSNNHYKQHAWTWRTKLFDFDQFRDDFIIHGFYANRKLLSKYASTVGVLELNHCTPDGLLFKLKRTGKTRRLIEKTCPSIAKLRIDGLKQGNAFVLPMVEGDLEIVEIKCGRNAKLMDKQKKTYNDLIAKDVPLRLIKVRIVSFDLNRFLVEEHKYDKFV